MNGLGTQNGDVWKIGNERRRPTVLAAAYRPKKIWRVECKKNYSDPGSRAGWAKECVAIIKVQDMLEFP
jgi:hypothetical protein